MRKALMRSNTRLLLTAVVIFQALAMLLIALKPETASLQPLILAAALNRFARCRFVLTAFVLALAFSAVFGGVSLALSPQALVRYLPVVVLIVFLMSVLLSAAAAFAVRVKANAAASAVGLVVVALLPAVGNYYLSNALAKGGVVPWSYVGLAALAALPAVVAFLLLGSVLADGRNGD